MSSPLGPASSSSATPQSDRSASSASPTVSKSNTDHSTSISYPSPHLYATRQTIRSHSIPTPGTASFPLGLDVCTPVSFLSQPSSTYSHATLSRSYRYSLLSSNATRFWETLDRSQVLGNGTDDDEDGDEEEDDDEDNNDGAGHGYGHTGCVNALCWREDGEELLSGSDDKTLCLWRASKMTDGEPQATNRRPHPLSLGTVILTGHQANIFSAKYLPHANTSQLVSCAGDSQVRVFDVERLLAVDTGAEGFVRGGLGRGGGWRSRMDGLSAQSALEHGITTLNGREGPGVRKILCHRDRVKRISTEDNPNIFLTVSEDGTVRQHDLRTTHTCRENCPPPLMEAPGNISLYTLSVSPINPYLFTVAGTSPYAFLQDRRMVKTATKEWGHMHDQGGKVQCVRRFGLLPDPQDEDIGNSQGVGAMDPQAAARRRRNRQAIRHITAVEMSPDVGEDLIVSFSGHSVGLFSIHDSPGETSARARQNSLLKKNEKASPGRRRPRPVKRARMTSNGDQDDSKERTASDISTNHPAAEFKDTKGPSDSHARESPTGNWAQKKHDRPQSLAPSLAQDISSPDISNNAVHSTRSGHTDLEQEELARAQIPTTFRSTNTINVGGVQMPVQHIVSTEELSDSESDGMEEDHHAMDDAFDHTDEDNADHNLEEEDDDGIFGVNTVGQRGFRGAAVSQRDMENTSVGTNTSEKQGEDEDRDPFDIENNDDHDDHDDDDHDDDDDDNDDGEDDHDDDDSNSDSDDDNSEEEEYWMEQEQQGLYDGLAGENEIYGDVPIVYPRRNYKGARNIETVKDVTFLGVQSDKVCSGSDDGNFFVWDKLTGRLEGIWEGDGQVTNVVQQHPSLPLLAVSGIDSTIKIFSPQAVPSDPSFRRTADADLIISNNTNPNNANRHARFGRIQLLSQYLNMMEQGGGEVEGVPDCHVQ